MGNTLDAPITDKESHEFFLGAEGCFQVGVAGMQGWRNEMEDAHICTDIPALPNHTLLAVFDGHGGKQTAEYARDHLLRALTATASWRAYAASPDRIDGLELLGSALKECFIELDREMAASEAACYRRSGSTALVCVVTATHVVCANAGDCRAIIGVLSPETPPRPDGSSVTISHIDLSKDHKPEIAEEKARIEASGHVVNFGRVDGDLAVCRGLGDLRFKDAGVLPELQAVSCVPDIYVHSRDSARDAVLLLACDGLFDVITSEQAAQRLLDIFCVGEASSKLIAEEMIDGALYEGRSRDNISAIVCVFPAGIDVSSAHSAGDSSIGVRGIRMERRMTGAMRPGYDMYDNVEFIPKVEPSPGSMFYTDDY